MKNLINNIIRLQALSKRRVYSRLPIYMAIRVEPK